jgi:hypothetical protein
MRHPPPHNSVQINIISFIVIFSRLRRSSLAAHSLFRVSPALLCLFSSAACAISPVPKRSDWPAIPPFSEDPPHSPIIVFGIVGGIVKHDDPIRSEVILAESLRADFPRDVYADTFENRHREKALRAILKHLDATGKSTVLSDNERRAARIILYGHSLGGSAVVQLARELNQRGIPVLLTIQVDSVRAPGQHDSVIPANVLRAANFYQPNGLIHGRSEIRAEDPSKTVILGNFKFDYKAHPVDCPEYPWHERVFTKTHMEIACDPNVWAQVEALIRQQIQSATMK